MLLSFKIQMLVNLITKVNNNILNGVSFMPHNENIGINNIPVFSFGLLLLALSYLIFFYKIQVNIYV